MDSFSILCSCESLRTDSREKDQHESKHTGLVSREEVDVASSRVIEQEVQGFVEAGLGRREFRHCPDAESQEDRERRVAGQDHESHEESEAEYTGSQPEVRRTRPCEILTRKIAERESWSRQAGIHRRCTTTPSALFLAALQPAYYALAETGGEVEHSKPWALVGQCALVGVLEQPIVAS